jgi:hypothetical protein
VVLLEPDPQKHCQLPMAQVSHESRDELEAPQMTLVETPESKDEFEAPQMTLVETSRSIDKLEAQITQVHTPSLYLVPVGLNSSDYLHSAPTDERRPFRIIT